MINELYGLSEALKKVNIASEGYHQEYTEIPNINVRKPCVRIVFSGNQVSCLERVDEKLGKSIRRYGSKQGSFPAMNLAPLYRITNAEQKKELEKILKANDGQVDISRIKTWCTCNNWGDKFFKKYRNSIQNIPAKLEKMLQGEAAYEPILRLIQAVRPFTDPAVFHAELEKAAFRLLEMRLDTSLALQILFYVRKEGEGEEGDYGKLSVILDDKKLEEEGISSATAEFTEGLNQALRIADATARKGQKANAQDAFGMGFASLEKPMPTVKLAGGFEVSLRTMFKGQPCQYRYGKIDNATYPIAPEMRSKMKSALEWLSREERRNITWVSTDKREIVFIYPSHLTEEMPSYTALFQPRYAENQKVYFESEAKDFAEYLTKTKLTDPENYPDNIQIFMLRKVDNARTRVLYTRAASPDEIVLRSEEWQKASQNLPELSMRYPWTPFPLRVSNIMNRAWKRDGTPIANKLKPVPGYHGMELLFGVQKQILEKDLHMLVNSCTTMALYVGERMHSTMRYDSRDPFLSKVQDTVMMTGMILYWLGSRKEDYMKEYPYLLGQLLKISDNLHELYCFAVRDKQLPAQLVGSSMYVAASEMPLQAFTQLANRMIPYIAWAKVNREVCVRKKQKNSQGEEVEYFGPSAGYLLYAYEQVAGQLGLVLEDKRRFSDYEKAQMFIGYLAALPKKENSIS